MFKLIEIFSVYEKLILINLFLVDLCVYLQWEISLKNSFCDSYNRRLVTALSCEGRCSFFLVPYVAAINHTMFSKWIWQDSLCYIYNIIAPTTTCAIGAGGGIMLFKLFESNNANSIIGKISFQTLSVVCHKCLRCLFYKSSPLGLFLRLS